MQGDKLIPCHENIVGSGLRLGAPDRRSGDDILNAAGDLGQPAAAELGDHRLAIRRSTVRENIDQLALHPRGYGMPELDAGELLEMLVQQPGMVDDSLQDQRLAARYGGAVTAMDRARRQLWARDDVTFALRANSE